MTSTSFDRLLKSSRLAMPAIGKDEFIADRSIRIARADRERLDGKVNNGRARGGGSSGGQKLVKQLSQRLKSQPPRPTGLGGKHAGAAPMEFDRRQRAVVKIHYFNHTGGGGAALKAHGQYIEREAAARRDPWETEVGAVSAERPLDETRAHAAYLERGKDRGVFYDAKANGIDGAARLDGWAKSDRRHFRLILSAEEGARLGDLPAFTREVMARAGSALGTTLSWVAVDHHDTDNPHTHIVVRGRRANGQDLVMPKDFIKHGLRGIARDVATESLGRRSPDDERLALDRETRRHGPTRLDRMLAGQIKEGVGIRLADVHAPNRDAALTQALKARLRELQRMGLGEDVRHNVIRLTPEWRERLQSMELHLDIRKRIVRERVDRGVAQQVVRHVRKGLIDR